jgi:hypothetical protein
MSKRKYRINESFELIGAFWRPDDRDKTVTGTLTSRGGRVEVITAPSYIANLEGDAVRDVLLSINNLTNPERIPILHGATSDKWCTLINSLVLDDRRGTTNFPLGYQISATRIIPARTIMGVHVPSADSKSLDSAVYYFTKLHHLLPKPWSTQLSNETHSYAVPMDPTEVFKFTSKEMDSEVICEVRAGGGWTAKRGVAIRPQSRLRVLPYTPQSLDWFNALAFRLENFFTLFLGTSLSVKHVQVIKGEDAGWVIQKINNRNEKIHLQMWVRCPFEAVSKALMKWLAVPDDKQSIELTVLGVVRKSTLFNETEFLSLAQALEGFGRITFVYKRSARPSFATLIKQTYELLSPEFAEQLLDNKDDFTKKVVQTRDYYTHLGNVKKTAAVRDSSELFLLNKRLHAFLRCVILIDLGIPEQYLKDPILYQATRWQIW